jgi:hypothetical protein
MTESFQVCVYDREQLVYAKDFAGVADPMCVARACSRPMSAAPVSDRSAPPTSGTRVLLTSHTQRPVGVT